MSKTKGDKLSALKLVKSMLLLQILMKESGDDINQAVRDLMQTLALVLILDDQLTKEALDQVGNDILLIGEKLKKEEKVAELKRTIDLESDLMDEVTSNV